MNCASLFKSSTEERFLGYGLMRRAELEKVEQSHSRRINKTVIGCAMKGSQGNICVFTGSRHGVRPEYATAARQLADSPRFPRPVSPSFPAR